MTVDARKRHRQWGWGLLLLTVLFGFAGWAGWSEFDRYEQGETIRTSRRAKGFYDAFGKNGFLVLGVGGAVGCLAVGAWRLVRGYGPDHAAGADGRTAPCPRCRGELPVGVPVCLHCRSWLKR